MIKVDIEFEKRSKSIEKKKTIASTINYMYNKYSHNPSIVELLGQLSKEVSDLGGNLYDDSHRKFLSEIIVEEKPNFSKQNLIVSPIGSGKSTFIEKVLIDPNSKEDYLYVTYEKQEYGETYIQLQEKLDEETNFLDNFKYIIFDDFNMALKNVSNLTLKYFLEKTQLKQVFYFTDKKDEFLDFYSKIADEDKIKVIDYNEHSKVKKYVEINKTRITDLCGLDNFFNETMPTRDPGYNYKGVAIGDTLDELGSLEINLKHNGMRTVSLWTTENSNEKLSEEQIRVLNFIKNERRIPIEYDVLVLSKEAFKYLLFDDFKIKYAIIKDTHEEENLLKKHRHCVNLVVYKSTVCLDELEEKQQFEIESWIGFPRRPVEHRGIK